MMRPSETGFAPSTSLAGSMTPASSASRAPAGSGVARIIPWTAGSPLSSVSTASVRAMAAGELSAARSMMSQLTPTLAAAVASDRRYQALASSAWAVTAARRGGRPAAASSAARAAVAARISAASSRPGSSFTG